MPRPVSYDYNKRTGILSGAQLKREGESNLSNQEQKSICREIGARTVGDIYIGVVGPVRSGKSTFIKRFMEQLVLPAIGPAAVRERARDELPQSAAGRTIMTTEPKFIPEAAVPLQLEGGGECRVRIIDCVGYMVECSQITLRVPVSAARSKGTSWSNHGLLTMRGLSFSSWPIAPSTM